MLPDALPFGFSEAPEILIPDGRTSDPDQWLDEAARYEGIGQSMAMNCLPRWRDELLDLEAAMLGRREHYQDLRRAAIRDAQRARFRKHQKGMANLFGVTEDQAATEGAEDHKHDQVRGDAVHMARRHYRQARIDWMVCLVAIRNGEKLVKEAVERVPDAKNRWRNGQRGRQKYGETDPGDGEE